MMKNIKKNLYFCMFSSLYMFLIMPMDLQTMQPNGSLSYPNNSVMGVLPNQTNFEQKNPVQFFLTQEQEKNNILLNEMRDKIDENHLGINKDIWFRGIRGAFSSYCKKRYLNDQQVTNEMSTIESYISQDNKEYMLKELEKRHWYVNYLLQHAVDGKIEEINKVKGTTVDTLFTPPTQDTFKKMVHIRALNQYFAQSRINLSLFDGVPMGYLGDIHWIVLHGHTENLYRDGLKMSSDGKYLLSIDIKKNKKVWDMEEGVATGLSAEDVEQGDVRWIDSFSPDRIRYCVLDSNNNYYAETFTPYVSVGENRPPKHIWEIGRPSNIPVIIEKNEPAILLFKRPTEISYLCQQAFYNSKNDPQELRALNNSNLCNSIESFPQENLKKRIEKKLGALEARL